MSKLSFQEFYNSANKEYAEEILIDVVNRRSKPTLRSSYGSYAYYSVPVIKQATSIYCGFASMQQVLQSLSYTINGTTDYAKQTTLKNRQNAILNSQGAQGSSTGVVSYMVVVLNEYINTKKYMYYTVTDDSNFDISDFKTYTYGSLANDRPVILSTKTASLGYYNGTNYTHYIVVDYIDYTHSQIETSDCCWTDAYRGHFMASIQEAYNATKNRWMICMS